MNNLLLQTDVYKFGHKDQYPPGTNKVYSYLESRGEQVPFIPEELRTFIPKDVMANYKNKGNGLDYTVFFGLQYYIKKYLQTPITDQHVDEWLEISKSILGSKFVNEKQMRALVKLKYLPIEIRAVDEGTVVAPLRNALMTITNTHPDFAWLVNYLETLLMKLWLPITVASNSFKFRMLFERFADRTCDNNFHVPYQMHDFGYRGVGSEESAAIAGSAHLTSFLGTDTTAAVKMLGDNYNYGDYNNIGASVPASEHSVMCAWDTGNDDRTAIQNMLDIYPTGIVSVVSDSYNLWRTITDYYGMEFKERILSRDGKVVVRPDSGDPVKIVCGDPTAKEGSNEYKGVIRLLDEYFGSTINSKGFKVLNPKIGCIYGDGIFYERAEQILTLLSEKGYASSNIVFGSGGLLLNQFSRDTQKLAIKATYCEVDGKARPIEKNPITDTSKKSKKGLLSLRRTDKLEYSTFEVDTFNDEHSVLSPAFVNSQNVNETNIKVIRNNINQYIQYNMTHRDIK